MSWLCPPSPPLQGNARLLPLPAVQGAGLVAADLVPLLNGRVRQELFQAASELYTEAEFNDGLVTLGRVPHFARKVGQREKLLPVHFPNASLQGDIATVIEQALAEGV
jgi:hypothetical protein